MQRQNKYHKPLFSLRHSWRVSDKLYISNMAYASYGCGGGTRLENSLIGDYTPDEQVDFKFYNSNTIGASSPAHRSNVQRLFNEVRASQTLQQPCRYGVPPSARKRRSR